MVSWLSFLTCYQVNTLGQKIHIHGCYSSEYQLWVAIPACMTARAHMQEQLAKIMMMSSNGNIFCITGPLCGEFTGPGDKGQCRGALMFSLICIWINGWVNNCEAGDLRHHHGHYDVIIMWHHDVNASGSCDITILNNTELQEAVLSDVGQMRDWCLFSLVSCWIIVYNGMKETK